MREKTLKLEINGKSYSVTINEFSAYEAVVTVNDKTYTVGLKDLGIEQVSDLQPKATFQSAPSSVTPMTIPSSTGPMLHKPKTISSASAIAAPLPGLILKLSVKEGDMVKAGQHVIIMEAMKMENEIQAPKDGKVKSVLVKEGDSVNEGDILIELE
ncbi:MAG: biotin/lipoyl-binding protein [Candidatus Marinimicrobia bacterium]|nr:biotin/lipoyl-binding protein [Candidatus Neomarinimicrobiota bacterium]